MFFSMEINLQSLCLRIGNTYIVALYRTDALFWSGQYWITIAWFVIKRQFQWYLASKLYMSGKVRMLYRVSCGRDVYVFESEARRISECIFSFLKNWTKFLSKALSAITCPRWCVQGHLRSTAASKPFSLQ